MKKPDPQDKIITKFELYYRTIFTAQPFKLEDHLDENMPSFDFTRGSKIISNRIL